MSIRIALDNAPEFYTNLDVVQGRVIVGVSRHENVGAIVVKLEGESKTALAVPDDYPGAGQGNRASNGEIVHENHKILYKVAQVFPDENTPAAAGPFMLAPGQHAYPFRFRIPFNNSCSDPSTARAGSLSGPGGITGPGRGLFGLGGLAVMAGTKQLLYSHVTKTLPPSFTGFPRQAEIRYYIKVTVQRPGLFKENWRYHVGFKFLPIEPPRPPASTQEAFARRPFNFRPRDSKSQSASAQGSGPLYPSSRRPSSNFSSNNRTPSTPGVEKGSVPSFSSPLSSSPSSSPTSPLAPSIEMSARLPHPSILTCNKPVPLRLIAKKLVPAAAEVLLVSIQIDLIGSTLVRCDDLANTETSRWVVMSRHGLSISISQPSDAVGTEFVVPDNLWNSIALPNTVMPSFSTCNLSRSYQLEVKLGLSYKASSSSSTSSSFFKGKARAADATQAIHLPLHFSEVTVYSGLAPPPSLVEAMRKQQQQQSGRRKPVIRPLRQQSQPRPQQHQQQQQQQARPPMPPRPATQQPPAVVPIQAHDPLYPPQLAPGQDALDDAPPSYDEAMAESMAGPAVPDGTSRPAYSGVTNENGPSTIPEKE